MTQAHSSMRHIDVNLLKIDRSNANFEILKSIKISVQRLGASAFAIKMSAEQTIIYQGIFKLLNDGADKIVGELRSLLQKMKTSYDTASEFVEELGQLADQGTRFSRLVAEFLNKAFLKVDETDEITVQLKLQTLHTSEAITCATIDDTSVLLVGRNGGAWNGNAKSGAFAARFRVHDRNVHVIKMVQEVGSREKFMAFGTDEGLQVSSVNGDFGEYTGSFRERVIAIATPPWGRRGSRGTIVSGSREGIVRRWTLAEDRLSQLNEQSYEQVGRRLQCTGVTLLPPRNANSFFLMSR
jgi:hypothetical protein